MLALGLVLNTVGIGLFCWLIFTLAVYALPFFVAINAGIWAFHSGAGVLGTPLKRFPPDLNRRDSQRVKDERIFVH
jgi:hypothetical protein